MKKIALIILSLFFSLNIFGFACSENELIEFESKMMKSVSSQIKEAIDLTTTDNNRAVLAALLTLEFQAQNPDDTIDFSSPIYAAKSGTIAVVSFNTEKGYAIVMYQMNPLTTYYSFSDSKDSAIAKAALEMTSDEVWEVSYDLYLEKLTALVKQIK